MPIIGDVHIKVNSTVLNSKAQSVSNSIRSMANCFEQLETIINRTSYYWIGEAGDMHRKIYKEQRSQVDEMMKRLKEHPSDLLKIAGIMDNVVKEVEFMANSLPSAID